MAIRERLIYAIDIVTDGANKGLSNFKSSVTQAEGAAAKFKAGASSALASVQAAAGGLAIGAGAALVTLGAKAVGAFQDLALGAGKFSDATGLAVEDASRWIEVAGDVGVSAETMQGAFVKLNKALSTGDLKEFGVDLQRTSTGAVDVNATMLNAIKVIGGIKDPTERAEAAQKAFGRSYAEAAEIIFDNADNVQKKLSEVSDAKVIDEEELEKARRFREALDNLHDSLEDIGLVVGETLVPVLSKMADGINDVAGVADKLKALKIVPELMSWMNPIGKVGDAVRNKIQGPIIDAGESVVHWFGGGGEADKAVESFVNTAHNMAGVARGEAAAGVAALGAEVEDTGRRTQTFHEQVDLATAAIEMAADAVEDKAAADEKAAASAQEHAEQVNAVTDAMEAQKDAGLDLVGGDIAVRNAQRDAKKAAEDLNDVLDDQSTTFGQAGAAIDEAADAQLNAASAAADYRAKQMEANGQTVDANTKAQLLKEELQNLVGQLDGPLAAAIQNYIAQLGAIPKSVGTTIVLTKPGRVGDINPFQRTSGARASGGPTSAGGLYRVNENGSELLRENGKTYLMAGDDGTVEPLDRTSASAMPGAMPGSNVFYVTLNVKQALTPEEVINLTRKYERRNGAAWRS